MVYRRSARLHERGHRSRRVDLYISGEASEPTYHYACETSTAYIGQATMPPSGMV
ncbi:hypothetical protein ACFOEM_13755 [Paenalcaligenes hominis]|uniref:hypothetical protein n=1 Tax=Paenalcaligenes hominis TaxID=643674 RepID=UPI003609A766